MTNSPKISVIIVSWNVADALSACLKSVFATRYPNLEVIVIDNHSSDDSLKKVTHFKSVKLLKNSTNIGFPKAVNQGITASKGDYILLLNPDALLPPNFFREVLAYTTSHPGSIIGPRFTNPDGSPQGSVFPSPSLIRNINYYWLGRPAIVNKYSPHFSFPVSVFAISGGCMFIPRLVLNHIGLFTEKVFMYYEDIDYCRRAHKLGYSVIYHPDISIVHQHGASSAQTHGHYSFFWETLLYPLRKIIRPNAAPSASRYLNESGIWYNGWFKQLLITFVIWTGQKIHSPAV